MGYPSSGKRLEYIKSAEKNAYINLGFKPNQDTKVVLVASIPKSGVTFAIGTTTRVDGTNFMVRTFSANNYWCADYGDALIQMPDTSVTMGNKTVFVMDRNVCTIGGITATVPNTEGITFESGNLLLLAGTQTNGSAASSSGTIWSCQVYDNGTLIRDCVPWETEDGSVGLWDTVNDAFYGSAGSGKFAAGPEIVMPKPEHSTVIDGTAYALESGSVMIGGVVYEVENGRVMVDGVVYDVPFGVASEEMVVLYLRWIPPHGSRIVVNGVTYTEAEGDQSLAVPVGTIVEVWDYASHYNIITGEGGYQDELGNPLCLTINSGTQLVMDSSMGDDEVNLAEYAGDVGTYPIYIEGTSRAPDAFAVIANGNTTYSKDFEYGDYIYVREGAEVTVRNDSTSAKAIELNGTVVAEASVNAAYTFRMPKMDVEIDCYKAIRIRY